MRNQLTGQKNLVACRSSWPAATAAGLALQRISLALLLLGTCSPAFAQSQPLSFEGAKWIWFTADPNVPLNAFPGDSCYCRAPLVLPETTPVKFAEVIITADNLYTLYLNGRVAGASEDNPDAWNRPRRFEITSRLMPGRNMVAIEGVNTAPGPAGLVVKLVVETADGQRFVLVSDASWRCSADPLPNWQQSVFDDGSWQPARVVGNFGAAPWGLIPVPPQAEKPLDDSLAQGPVPADFPWPEGLVFLGDDCSLNDFPVCFHMNNSSRAYPEWDIPCPSLMGRKLYALRPARPKATPAVLLDAGKQGAIGSPSVSFDGQQVYVAMAKEGDSFFHIYRVPVSGGPPQQLTDGTFHDIDPAELPDGRIVFTSTRIGSFEEYHNPPSRALFTMQPDGSNVQPLTSTPIGDNEPKVMSDGRIAFVRSDNFFDRAKVETQIHAIHPDGSAGQTEAGAEVGADYGVRLRALGFGSPAPLPDGRLAVLSQMGNLVGRPGSLEQANRRLPANLTDISPLPDGRLLCTVRKALAVLDPNTSQVVPIYQSSTGKIHSPVYLGPRPRPPVLASQVQPTRTEPAPKTGFLFCQSVYRTRKTKADWGQVRSIRVLGGVPLTTRSSHSYVVHAGIDVVELGTVPLAPDGSFFVEVPANMPIAMQAVDAEGRSELNEMSWIYVRPGETRSCVGCHNRRQSAPASKSGFAQALRAAPLKLLGQGEPHKFRGNNSGVTGMMDLQFERFREIASIDLHSHRAAAAGASAKGWEREVQRLVEQLRGPQPDLKLSAAGRLSIFRERAAAPALADRLSDSNREVRVAAALALATCGTRASVPPLLDALTDSDSLVALAAAVALENLTGHAPPLPEFGPAKQRAVQATAWQTWLSANSWDAIEQALIQRLSDPDRVSQRRAIVALGHVGGDAARAALRAYVSQHKDKSPSPLWNGGNRIDSFTYGADSTLNPRTLQEAIRALGYLRDTAAVPLLAEIVAQNSTGIQVDNFAGNANAKEPKSVNMYLAEAALQALGRIATPAAEAALVENFRRFGDFHFYVGWYSDHPALWACHSSPLHHLALEALDALASPRCTEIVAQAIRSMPTDPDRALILDTDSCETLIGRVVQHGGLADQVTQTCLAILGDPQAKASDELKPAITFCPWAWAGTLDPECRAAQVLSAVCCDVRYEPQIRAAFDRYRAERPKEIIRTLSAPGPMPKRNWVSFFLARTLARLGDPQSVPALIAALEQDPPEAAWGRPKPTSPIVHYLQNEYTPCYRAAAAFALGRIGDKRAVPALLQVVGDFANATDTRHAAAVALGRVADPASVAALGQLAQDYPEVSTRRALLQARAKLSNQPPATPLD